MKKIIHLLSMSIKLSFENEPSRRFQAFEYLGVFSRYSSFKTGKLKLIFDVTYSRIRNEIYETKNISQKLVKFIQFFHEYAPTLHYYICVKFE